MTALACVSWAQRMQRVRFSLFDYSLLAIHLACLMRFVHLLGGRKETAWQPVN